MQATLVAVRGDDDAVVLVRNGAPIYTVAIAVKLRHAFVMRPRKAVLFCKCVDLYGSAKSKYLGAMGNNNLRLTRQRLNAKAFGLAPRAPAVFAVAGREPQSARLIEPLRLYWLLSVANRRKRFFRVVNEPHSRAFPLENLFVLNGLSGSLHGHASHLGEFAGCRLLYSVLDLVEQPFRDLVASLAPATFALVALQPTGGVFEIVD
jgi:hypothetical protein